MSGPLLLLVACIYFAVALDYARQERYGLALAWAAYAAANVGFVVDQR